MSAGLVDIDDLRELAMHDSTVHAYLAMQINSGISNIECLVGLVKALAQEKKAFFDDAVWTRNNSIVPIIMPKEAES